MSGPEIVRVELGARGYDVVIGANALDMAGGIARAFAASGRVHVVTDHTVLELHGARLVQALKDAGLCVDVIAIEPGEESKSYAGLEQVCGALLEDRIERRDLVIAFGGGVIGDLAGFAAGIVLRGVDFIQIPTTLLAQVDSSVGGKTAIDTSQGKNLVGLFHQPRAVIADLGALKTLPERQLRAGYAEVVKYGLIDDFAFYEWCEANVARILAGDAEALAYAVKTSVEAKARIVAADEREAGQRALLNLGHTFAHALEVSTGYGDALLHGEAVGTGMALAFGFSAHLGLSPAQEAERVRAHLRQAGFALDLNKLPGAPYDVDALIDCMGQDKKAEAGELTFILARGIGQCFVQKRVARADVRAFLEKVLAE